MQKTSRKEANGNSTTHGQTVFRNHLDADVRERTALVIAQR
jgi:hypothetical protein